jgi:hypothetical protein
MRSARSWLLMRPSSCRTAQNLPVVAIELPRVAHDWSYMIAQYSAQFRAKSWHINASTCQRFFGKPHSGYHRSNHSTSRGRHAMLPTPPRQIHRLPAGHLADRQWPSRTITTAADLDEHRPARRQPGLVRADERRAQDAHVQDALRHRLQGNRSRLPVGLADRFRLRAQPDRRRPHSRRRDHRSAHPGARAPDPPHLRSLKGARRAIVHVYNATSPSATSCSA